MALGTVGNCSSGRPCFAAGGGELSQMKLKFGLLDCAGIAPGEGRSSAISIRSVPQDSLFADHDDRLHRICRVKTATDCNLENCCG